MHLKTIFKTGGFLFATAVLFTACTKLSDVQHASIQSSSNASNLTGFENLIAYKNSPHQLFMGYYRTWGDYVTDSVHYKTRMTDLPDSIDIVSIFTDYTPDTNRFWDTLKYIYVPYLHARGTKVIYTGGYFSGASTDSVGLANWVQGILSKIQTYNYDGYDLDIESTASGTTLQDEIATFRALSKYLGPQSGTGKLLVYDTNQDGNALVSSIKNLINYVFLQAYWRKVSSLQGTYNTYSSNIAPNKFLVGVSYEDGTGYNSDQMPAYAAWQPSQGTKGGVFAYGIDMEGPSSGRNFVTTRAAIQKMNPAGSTTTTGTTNAVSFTSGYISAGDVTQLKNTTKFTFEGWVKFTSTGNWSTIYSKSTSGTNRIVLQTGAGDGKLYAFVGNGSNSYGYTASNAVTSGQWYHVAMVFDGSQTGNANRLKIFINGTQQTLTFSGTIPSSTNNSNTAAFLAGSETTASTNTYLNGIIDEVRVWNVALSSSTISDWKNKQLGNCHPNASNLVLYWPLDNVSSASTAKAGLATTYNGNITNGTYLSSTQASTASGCP